MLTLDHAAKLTDLPDDQMGDILPMAKKLAKASGAENYNILQVGNAGFVSLGPVCCRFWSCRFWRSR